MVELGLTRAPESTHSAVSAVWLCTTEYLVPYLVYSKTHTECSSNTERQERGRCGPWAEGRQRNTPFSVFVCAPPLPCGRKGCTISAASMYLVRVNTLVCRAGYLRGLRIYILPVYCQYTYTGSYLEPTR